MFSASEKYYDEIYASLGKDYPKEAGKVHKFIQKHKRSEGNTLLDVACGTGAHAEHLGKYYEVEGLNFDRKMLSIARKKNPAIRFHRGNMVSFDLGRQFDAVTCLFSSIGYAKTKAHFRRAIKTMSRHVLPGGVLLVEPWFAPEQWKPGRVFMLHVDKPDLKITRMSYSGQKRKISTLEFHYMIGTPKGVRHSIERHELGLFTHKEYVDALRSSGLEVVHDAKGLDGRGLYIGRKPIKP